MSYTIELLTADEVYQKAVLSFDPGQSVWNLIHPINGSVPHSIDIGLTAVSNERGSSLWIFGGLSNNGDFLSFDLFWPLSPFRQNVDVDKTMLSKNLGCLKLV